MITRIRLLLFIYLFCTNSINGILSPSRVENTIQMDMNHYQKITFDSLITDISCTKLSNTVFDFCTNMVQYKDFLYFMGSTMAGKNVYTFIIIHFWNFIFVIIKQNIAFFCFQKETTMINICNLHIVHLHKFLKDSITFKISLHNNI